MKKVFVSGGSGYIALYCIKILLSKGYYVVTSARNESKINLVRESLSKQDLNTNNIEFHILDLLDDRGWDNALRGCEYVLHMASPVIFEKHDKDLLVKPAVEGMVRCLNSAIKNGAKRFVQTSSFAAVYGNNKTEYDDNDWTDLSYKGLLPYEISKTKSEKKMWEIANKSNIEACAINPVLVIGPSLSGIISTSNILSIKRLFNLPFIPKISISVVGVQDVADAHIRAMESPNSVGKRFLLSEKTISLSEISSLLNKSGFSDVPSYILPNFILKFAAFFIPSLRLIAKRLGKEEILHTNNANNILNWHPNSVNSEIINTAKQLYEMGLLKK